MVRRPITPTTVEGNLRMRVPAQLPGLASTRFAGMSLILVATLAACGGSAPTATPAGVVASSAATPSAPAPSAAPSAPALAPASSAPASSSSPSLQPLALLWEKGGPTPSQPETFQPAVDPATGNVWVAASYDNKFWIFSPDGKYLESWGTPGKGDGQLALTTNDMNPDGRGSIAFLADGSYFVADTGNYRVQKFDRNRHYVSQFGGFGHGDGKFSRPLQMATDGKTIFVTDDDLATIQAFDMGGRYLRAFPWTSYGGFTLDDAGRLVTALGAEAEPTKIVVFVLDAGTGQRVATYPLPPIGRVVNGLAVSATGDIFANVAANDGGAAVGLVELDPTGKVIGTWSTAGQTAAVAPDGKAIYLGSNWPYIRKYALPKP